MSEEWILVARDGVAGSVAGYRSAHRVVVLVLERAQSLLVVAVNVAQICDAVVVAGSSALLAPQHDNLSGVEVVCGRELVFPDHHDIMVVEVQERGILEAGTRVIRTIVVIVPIVLVQLAVAVVELGAQIGAVHRVIQALVAAHLITSHLVLAALLQAVQRTLVFFLK